MIRSLEELKRALKPGVRYEITFHKLLADVGKVREVRMQNTAGFYSVDTNSFCDGANGALLWWGDASQWEFDGNECSFYDVTDHGRRSRVMSFHVLEQQWEEAA